MKTLYDVQRTSQIRQQALQRQQKAELAKALSNNAHTMLVMNEAEFFELAINIKRQQGASDTQILSWLQGLTGQSKALEALWSRHEGSVKSLISFAPTALDIAALGVLAKDLSKGGNILTKYQIKNYHGRSYVIIKGYPALRQHLTGTRYLASNPKVVSMGIGKLGAARSIRGGFIVSLILSVGFHALDQLFNDQKTWHHFVGNVAADLTYIAGSLAISSILVAVFVGGTAAITIGPLLVVLVSGFLLSQLFSELDRHIQLGKTMSSLLQEAENNSNRQLTSVKRQASSIRQEWSEDAKALLHRIFAIPNIRMN